MRLFFSAFCWVPFIAAMNMNAQIARPVSGYPPTIEASQARLQAAEEAWGGFLNENRLAYVRPDLDPILCTPHSLPVSIANQIDIKPPEAKGDMQVTDFQAREYLRRFIERNHALLGGDQRRSTLALKDVSLVSFNADKNMFRASYRQMNYPFPLHAGFGMLTITISKSGMLLQLTSTIIPLEDFTARAKLEPGDIRARFVGRQFRYADIAGNQKTYQPAGVDEIEVGSLVIYPARAEQKVKLHLVYPIEVGRGMTWTVYVDAVTGEEVATQQNFAS